MLFTEAGHEVIGGEYVPAPHVINRGYDDTRHQIAQLALELAQSHDDLKPKIVEILLDPLLSDEHALTTLQIHQVLLEQQRSTATN